MVIDWKERISSNPKVLVGKPAIIGARIGVDLIFEKPGSGEPVTQILESYPNISKEDIEACLLFASEYIRDTSVFSS
ncbi:MAG: DUF433 domain-containing protein [Chitinophagales bacterium]